MASTLISVTARPILSYRRHHSSSVRPQSPGALAIPKLDFTAPLYLRSNDARRLRVKQTLLLPIVFASDNNPSDASDNSPRKKSSASKTSVSVPQGAPLLTIVAGYVVLFAVLGVLASISVARGPNFP